MCAAVIELEVARNKKNELCVIQKTSQKDNIAKEHARVLYFSMSPNFHFTSFK
jgi:hypothetical protein